MSERRWWRSSPALIAALAAEHAKNTPGQPGGRGPAEPGRVSDLLALQAMRRG